MSVMARLLVKYVAVYSYKDCKSSEYETEYSDVQN